MVILVYYKGVFEGYLKSLSQKKNTYTVTKDIKYAKKYHNIDYIHYDIDLVTGMKLGIVCMYD